MEARLNPKSSTARKAMYSPKTVLEKDVVMTHFRYCTFIAFKKTP